MTRSGIRVLVLVLPAILLLAAPALPQRVRVAVDKIPAQDRSVEVFGQKIQYLEAGAEHASVIILLHGLGGDANEWAANIGPLAQSYHVYALDQVGFGRSDKPFLDYKIETFTDFLAGFMQELKISRATLVGNSLGGWIAAHFAHRYPGKVEKLVLVDAVGLKSGSKSWRELAPRLNPASIADMRRVLNLIFYNHAILSDDFVRQAFESYVKSGDGYATQRILAGIASEDQWEDSKLSSVRASTLIIWGREDALARLALGREFNKRMAGSQMEIIPDCGHFPHIEKPARFNQVVLNFLSGGKPEQ
jgi:pimeloyl-ACP methyl ester carboxylesterase